jgi:hypothetical protein
MDWLLAPFLGLSAVLLVLHNLIYFDLTLSQSTPWIWVAVGSLWPGLLLKNGLRPLLANCPWHVLLVMAAVYHFQGMGLFVRGADVYLGRATGDQYNYTALAQMLCDFPFSTTWDTIGQHPFLVEGLILKTDRTGAMILQGFFACSAGTEAKNLFEATILLSPALVVVAVYAVVQKLAFGSRALATAALAGVLPALTILHLDSFLSHALAVPFLLMLLVVLSEVASSGSWRTILFAGVLLASTTSVYTEFVPILLFMLFLFCVGGTVLRSLRAGQECANCLKLIALMFGLNPWYFPSMVQVLQRVTQVTSSNSGMHFVGESDQVAGFAAVWSHDWFHGSSIRVQAIIAVSFVLTGLAVLGLVRLCWGGLAAFSKSGRADPRARERVLLSLAVLALTLLPVPAFLTIEKHSYQFVKLLLTIGPLLVVGLVYLGHPTMESAQASGTPVRSTLRASWLRRAMGWPLLTGVLLIAVNGSASMTIKTLHARRVTAQGKSCEYYNEMHESNRYQALQLLKRLRDQPLVLACGPGLQDNCWFCYAGRHNPIWLVNPELNYGLLVGCKHAVREGKHPLSLATHLIELHGVPQGALVLTRVENDQVAMEGEHRLLWSNQRFQLWKLGPGPCTLRPLKGVGRPDDAAIKPVGSPVSSEG